MTLPRSRKQRCAVDPPSPRARPHPTSLWAPNDCLRVLFGLKHFGGAYAYSCQFPLDLDWVLAGSPDDIPARDTDPADDPPATADADYEAMLQVMTWLDHLDMDQGFGVGVKPAKRRRGIASDADDDETVREDLQVDDE